MEEQPEDTPLYPMRLQKFLARAGVASRRGSEDLMTAGRVRVNGEVVTELGSKVDPVHDEVTVDGKPVSINDGSVYLMLHKPTGCLTTMDDPYGRPCVAALVPTDAYPGLFPVGRLDKDTSGLLLFTTDGELGNVLLHPKHHVEKTYEALIEGPLCDAELDPLRVGVELDDGPCNRARVTLITGDEPAAQVRITINEGRNRQVRRMFEAIGHPVIKLHRPAFGPLSLGDLPEGKWRMLSATEVADLKAATETM
ncbi:MAG: rRNA pseudouridine synthase [Coriobacteriaceae bacterium]|nr:rRNA pseudouridine synthase [Coriobacteriaceae bacterium]